MIEVEINDRRCAYVDLADINAANRKSEFLEVCDWQNLMGFDVTICDDLGNRVYSFTYDSYQALIAAIEAIKKQPV